MRLEDMDMSLTPRKHENSINSSAIDVEAEKTKNTTKKNQERARSSHYMDDPVLTTNVSFAD